MFVLLAQSVPVELHLDATVLVGINLFSRGAHHHRRLQHLLQPTLRRRRAVGHGGGHAIEVVLVDRLLGALAGAQPLGDRAEMVHPGHHERLIADGVGALIEAKAVAGGEAPAGAGPVRRARTPAVLLERRQRLRAGDLGLVVLAVVGVDLEPARVEQRGAGIGRQRGHRARVEVELAAVAGRREAHGPGHARAGLRAGREDERRVPKVVVAHIRGLGLDRPPVGEARHRFVRRGHGGRHRAIGDDWRVIDPHRGADRDAADADGGRHGRRDVDARGVEHRFPDGWVGDRVVGEHHGLHQLRRARRGVNRLPHGPADGPADRAGRRPQSLGQGLHQRRRGLEVEEDPLLGQEAPDEGIVGLLILHAIDALLVRAGQLPQPGNAGLEEDDVHHLVHAEVLEDARVLVQLEEPHLRHDPRRVDLLLRELLRAFGAQARDDALDEPRRAAVHGQGDRGRAAHHQRFELGHVQGGDEGDVERIEVGELLAAPQLGDVHRAQNREIEPKSPLFWRQESKVQRPWPSR